MTGCWRVQLNETAELCCRIVCRPEKCFCDRLWEAKTKQDQRTVLQDCMLTREEFL